MKKLFLIEFFVIRSVVLYSAKLQGLKFLIKPLNLSSEHSEVQPF